jgi:broad specificity phosphatase PhoE
MKIGLFRHFKVDHRTPAFCNSVEYDKSCLDYENGKIIIPGRIDRLAGEYDICYASSMKRAVDTARLVYDGEIIITDELVEIPLRAIFNTKLKLPFKLWNIINRMGWLFNSKRVPETKSQSLERVDCFLANLLTGKNNSASVLIVSHGLFLATLQIQLSKLGFKGEPFFRAEHSVLYKFEKT